jgi:hypothetical protein
VKQARLERKVYKVCLELQEPPVLLDLLGSPERMGQLAQRVLLALLAQSALLEQQAPLAQQVLSAPPVPRALQALLALLAPSVLWVLLVPLTPRCTLTPGHATRVCWNL